VKANLKCSLVHYRADGEWYLAALSYRLWIIWNKNTKVAYGLSGALLSTFVASLIVMVRFVDSMTSK
jgi:hypothetical protein